MYATLIQSNALSIWSCKSRYKTWGVGLLKKPKDLSAHEREEREHGDGRDVYDTLLQSDTVQSYGLPNGGTRPGGWTVQKNKGPECIVV